jgi:ribonuclease G
VAEIFYTVSPDLHRMARLEGKEVVELDFEIPGKPSSLLGGIFLGRVMEIQKPLHAAFVDIGEEKPGLLPLREGTLAPLTQGESVMVQVSRTANPLEEKGVRLTRLITLSLGPLLYTPFVAGLSVSKRLKERHAFKSLLNVQPEEGLIIRHGASREDPLQNLLFQLRNEWATIQRQLPAKPSFCLRAAPPLLTRIVRSLTPSDTLVVDDRLIASRIKATFSREPAFDERCEEAWDSLLSPEVPLPQGGNLYIEETRGLVVIDVNSEGSLRHKLPFNRVAIQEAFRQIRLRHLSGKIVIDLIDTPKVLKPLLEGFTFPSDLEIFGLSAIGLLEAIRRRRSLSLPQRLKYQLN